MNNRDTGHKTYSPLPMLSVAETVGAASAGLHSSNRRAPAGGS